LSYTPPVKKHLSIIAKEDLTGELIYDILGLNKLPQREQLGTTGTASHDFPGYSSLHPRLNIEGKKGGGPIEFIILLLEC
jgi:hypothetical protein